jgi:hypothetical protein
MLANTVNFANLAIAVFRAIAFANLMIPCLGVKNIVFFPSGQLSRQKALWCLMVTRSSLLNQD